MKRILTAILATFVCMVVLPILLFRNARGWDVLGYTIIFFFIIYPAHAVLLGILAGTDIKKLWWLPVAAAAVFPPLFWLSMGAITLELYLYAALYLAGSFVIATPVALVKYVLEKRKA